jgi:hypothetical protein
MQIAINFQDETISSHIRRKIDTVIVFSFLGASVYEISKQVIDTKISPLVKIA